MEIQSKKTVNLECLNYPFDGNEILKKKKSLRRHLINREGLLEKRVAILSGAAVGDIESLLELFLLGCGIKPVFYIGGYNRFYEDVMFENKELTDFKPDIIYIHTSVRNLADNTFTDKLQAVWSKIREKFSCAVIQNNFELPLYPLVTDSQYVNAANLRFAEYASQNNDFYINDLQYLSSCFGLEEWHSDQAYFLYKYPFSIKAMPAVSHNIAKIIKSMYGKNKKCLVLDLDNTLWGGIAGDVGAAGIELGMETALGEAYINFQKYVKALGGRGVILAVCSKNDERTALEAFSNPNMILRVEDFAVFCANWNNKAENIAYIAERLNLLPESLVFIDDNPAEREIVRRCLPEAVVPEVSSVTDFIRHIEGAGYFYSVRASADDINRKQYYANDAQRNKEMHTFVDYGEYLCSLRMSSQIRPFIPEYLERITQLINKTNQFNLTNKRYTFSEIEKIAANSRFITLFASLDDKFGSSGIVSVLIGEIESSILHVKLWVMSCRVFKRDLELAVFDCLVDVCKNKGLKKIVGYYYKTEKNGFVSSLYDNLGFAKISDEIWELDVPQTYRAKNKYISVQYE